MTFSRSRDATSGGGTGGATAVGALAVGAVDAARSRVVEVISSIN
jgi:hypothetical protein